MNLTRLVYIIYVTKYQELISLKDKLYKWLSITQWAGVWHSPLWAWTPTTILKIKGANKYTTSIYLWFIQSKWVHAHMPNVIYSMLSMLMSGSNFFLKEIYMLNRIIYVFTSAIIGRAQLKEVGPPVYHPPKWWMKNAMAERLDERQYSLRNVIQTI